MKKLEMLCDQNVATNPRSEKQMYGGLPIKYYFREYAPYLYTKKMTTIEQYLEKAKYHNN